MRRAVKPRTDRDFPRRRERARVTRERVLAAARALFIDRGYVGTTIDAIAEQADVSPETIYSTFGSKRALLAELVDVTIAGGVDAPAVFDQGWVRELREEPDARRRLAILARNGRTILERRADVDEVVRGAASAEPELAALRDRGKADRFAGQRQLLNIVVGAAGPRPGLDLDDASDILYAIGSPEMYRLFVVDRGWTADRFEAWYAETLERLLFPVT
ncbi:MAG: helix-turn-helix domain-containing protein [Candidatus Limnocylindrales bacterium]